MDDPSSTTTWKAIEGALRHHFGVDSIEVTGVDAGGHGHSAENWIVSAMFRSDDATTPMRRFVVRRQSHDRAWDSPRDQESRFLQIVNQHTTIPAPTVLWFDGSRQWLDSPFIVEDYIDGIADYNLFKDVRRSEQERIGFFQQFLDILVEIHSVDWQGLKLDFLGPRSAIDVNGNTIPYDDPAARELRRVQVRLEELGTRFQLTPSIEHAFAWLAANKPSPGRLCLVHADYGPHNTLIVGDQVRAVLDWEFAIISDPAQDVGWFTLRGRSIRDNFDQSYYTAAQFREAYTKRTGYRLDLDVIRWWQVFGLCRTVVGRAHHGVDEAAINRPRNPGILRQHKQGSIKPVREDELLLSALTTSPSNESI